MRNKLYLIGSLRNERIPKLANAIRIGHPEVEVFDDWYSAGPEADDHWKAYEQARGRSYEEALEGYAAKHVFGFDRHHLDTSTHILLVLPAGKSGHMEIMYGCYGARLRPSCAILLDETDIRWDVMYQFIPTILNKDTDIGPWLEQSTGRRQDERRVLDGGWPVGLLPECIGGGVSTLEIGGRQASSWNAFALGKK